MLTLLLSAVTSAPVGSPYHAIKNPEFLPSSFTFVSCCLRDPWQNHMEQELWWGWNVVGVKDALVKDVPALCRGLN